MTNLVCVAFPKELLRVAKARLQLDDDPGEVAVAKARQLVEALEEKAGKQLRCRKLNGQRYLNILEIS